MHVYSKVKFFETFDLGIVTKLFRRFDQHLFAAGDVIERRGDISALMWIVAKGKVGLYLDDELQSEVGDNGTFGMNFAFGENPHRVRAVTAIALEETYCFSLDHAQFSEQVFLLEYSQRQARLSLLRHISIFEGWPSDKLKSLNAVMGQHSYHSGEIVYDLGDKPDKLFFLMRGELMLETEIDIEQKV